MSSMPPPPTTPPNTQRTASGSYASWGTRAGAWLIDTAIVVVPLVVVGIVTGGVAMSSIDPETGQMGGGGAGAGAVFWLVYLAVVVFQFWNVGWRQGTTGQSIGKGVTNIAVIKEQGGYMGGGLGIGRLLLHSIIGGFCFVNYLWPLWDDKNQTWTDKIIDTIVVDA